MYRVLVTLSCTRKTDGFSVRTKIRQWLLSLCEAALPCLLVMTPGQSANAQSPHWSQVPGLIGGYIDVLAVGPSADIFATSMGEGKFLYRSTDNGAVWSPAGALPAPNRLFVDPEGVILAYEGNLCRSTDRGETWAVIDSDFYHQVISFAHAPNGHLFIGTTGGIYSFVHNGGVRRSTDGGSTWQSISFADCFEVYALTVTPNGHIFAAVDAGSYPTPAYATGIYRSTDDGDSWTLSKEGWSMMLASDSRGQIFADVYGSLYRSSDDGADWNPVAGLDELGNDLEMFVTRGDQLFACGTSTTGTSRLVFRSSDGGGHWNRFSSADTTTRLIAVDSTGAILLGTGGFGVLRSSDDGATWDKIGFPFVTVTGVVLSPTGSWLVAVSIPTYAGNAASSGVYRSTDSGKNWQFVIPNQTISLLKVLPSGTVIACSGEGGLRSTDGGTSWMKAAICPPNILDISPIPTGKLLAGSSSGMFTSTDDGQTWTGAPGTGANSIVVDAGGQIFIGKSGIDFFSFYGVQSSYRDGLVWGDVGLLKQNVPSLARNSIDEIFAATQGNGVYRTTDDGAVWSQIGLAGKEVRCLRLNSYNHLFAGTWGQGVFSSTDDGVSWQNVSSGAEDVNVQCIAFDQSDVAYIGTESSGLYRTLAPTTRIGRADESVPRTILLEQNYPNPFNPATTIRYALPARAHVTLSVFTALGQQVARLVNENEDAGYHDVRFDGTGLASGLYFYRLQAGDYVATKKLVLLR
ncbi:MAG TPA: T9SS type A sorting domain-containing protein [Bacteroidota bacterium]|nr:T9SS type A sorting domain-containing protein [Bacteroidota bacterium]